MKKKVIIVFIILIAVIGADVYLYKHKDNLFAKKEPNLFRFLFLSSNTKSNNILSMVESKEGEEYISLIKSTTGLPDDLSKQIYINLWLIIHGIACMVSTTKSTITESECETILVDAFKGYRQVLMNKALNSAHLKK